MRENEIESDPRSLPGRLNGWKEIAAYLGKSVRTAQRWEKDLGLPVHRIHTGSGEIPFAFREEIDRWLLSTESQRAGSSTPEDSNGEPELGPLANAGLPATAGRRSALLRSPIRLVVLLLALLLPVTLWFRRSTWPLRLLVGPARQPATWRVEGGRLRVFDDQNQLLWEHGFGRPLLDATYAPSSGVPRDQSVFIADLDHDGNREVGIIAWAEPSPLPYFYVLNHDSSLRFSLQPDRTVQFGDTRYAPPWLPRTMLLTTEPDGSKSIWLAFVHNLWFPALLLKLDPQGKPLATYWSNGHIAALHEAFFQGRHAILVAGTNNENFAASLAVLDYASPSGSAPAAIPKYQCMDCPADAPMAFFLFPSTELSRLSNFRPMTHDVRVDGARNLVVNVELTPGGLEVGGPGGSAFYVLSSAGRVVEAETGDSYRMLHSRLEARNRLNHRFSVACEQQLFPVLRWDHATQRFVSEAGELGNPPR